MHFFLLLREFTISSLKTRKAIIFLVLYLAVFGLVMFAFFKGMEQVTIQFSAQGISQFQQQFAYALASSVIRGSAETSPIVAYLAGLHPVVIFQYFVMLIGTPIFILLVGYDKIAQEVYDGTIRYITFRTSRLTYYLAKFCSGLLENALVTLIATVAICTWATFWLPGFTLEMSLPAIIRLWLIAQIFLLVPTAGVLMVSGIFRKPFAALVASFSLAIAILISNIWIPYLSPLDGIVFSGLFFDLSPELLGSLAVYFCMSVGYLLIGFFFFSRKDV